MHEVVAPNPTVSKQQESSSISNLEPGNDANATSELGSCEPPGVSSLVSALAVRYRGFVLSSC